MKQVRSAGDLAGSPNDVYVVVRESTFQSQEIQDDLALFDDLKMQMPHKYKTNPIQI